MKTLLMLPLLAVIFTLTIMPAMASTTKSSKSGFLADGSDSQMLPMQKGKPAPPPKPIGPPKSGDE